MRFTGREGHFKLMDQERCDSLDGGDDGKYNGVGFVEIS